MRTSPRSSPEPTTTLQVNPIALESIGGGADLLIV
jgi:hypothetical protein